MNSIETIDKNITNFRKDTLDIEQFLTGTIASYEFFKNQYPEIVKEFNKKDRNSDEKEGMEIFKKFKHKNIQLRIRYIYFLLYQLNCKGRSIFE